jgi:hypothetical protein
MKRLAAILFCLAGFASAAPKAPALNYYSLTKYKFGFWFVAEPDRVGQTSASVQYILEVITSSDEGWFQPLAPIIAAPGSVLSFETVYGDGKNVFARKGFARIRVEYITPTPKDNNQPRQWVTLRPIQF